VPLLVLDLRRVTSIDETGAVALQLAGPGLRRRGVSAAGRAGTPARRRRSALAWPMPARVRLARRRPRVEAAERLLLGPAPRPRWRRAAGNASSLLQGLDAAQAKRVAALMTELPPAAGDTAVPARATRPTACTC
jgi:hypothetical protein